MLVALHAELDTEMAMNLMLGDCLDRMKEIPDGSVDLTVTSPPYDNLRTYNNSLDWGEHVWKPVLQELFRVTKQGGVVVWVVGDATIKGSETGTSFRQALFFIQCGFNLHDTMIYKKANAMPNAKSKRYRQCFEYMFILSKGEPKSFNPIMLDVKRFDVGKQRHKNGSIEKYEKRYSENKERKIDNIFEYGVGGMKIEHPAIFPEKLANDHIISWSNEGDVVLDCFMGSGTTGLAAKNLNRNFIGIEKDAGYFEIAKQRLGV